MLRVLFLTLIAAAALCAQDNYEIQVYGSETVKPGDTMIELHSNFTFSGSKAIVDGMYPTQHALHETLEITHGFNDWFETGFYVFTSENRGHGYGWVGDHIRPRVRAPESWKLPVGLSLSGEIGYQRKQYSPDTWTLELRPIIDKKLGKVYLAFNPTLDRSFHGPGVSQGVTFSPNFKVSYDVTKKVQFGIEYYGALGRIDSFDPIHEQQQQIIPSFDVDFAEGWEFNAGIGIGMTSQTDHLILKVIVGRRVNFGHSKKDEKKP